MRQRETRDSTESENEIARFWAPSPTKASPGLKNRLPLNGLGGSSRPTQYSGKTQAAHGFLVRPLLLRRANGATSQRMHSALRIESPQKSAAIFKRTLSSRFLIAASFPVNSNSVFSPNWPRKNSLVASCCWDRADRYLAVLAVSKR